MKDFIYGAISAFSLVAAYHLLKKLTNKSRTNVDTSINENEKFSMDSNETKAAINPKSFSFNKEYIEERKSLSVSSGLEIISIAKKSDYYFKYEIENVLINTNDKIVIFDVHEDFKPMISSLGAEYTNINPDDLDNDIMEKYDNSICGIGEPYDVSPLTERITCFNASNDDLLSALRYAFTKAWATARAEKQSVWFYIPSFLVSDFYSKQLFDIMKQSRKAGVIVTAAASMAAIMDSSYIGYLANNSYLVLTDKVENYNNLLYGETKNYIFDYDNIYQVDMGMCIEQDEISAIRGLYNKE